MTDPTRHLTPSPREPGVRESGTRDTRHGQAQATQRASAPPVRHVAASAEPRERGFRAMLQDAGLWGLVQLRCESRARSVARVTSPRGVGFLYFADGQIVHAAVGPVEGEKAALHILAWTAGTWDTCERAWPTRPSITTSWQGLLLRAAQLEDEARRPRTTTAAPSAKSASATPSHEPTARSAATTTATRAKAASPTAQAPAPATQAPAAQARPDESAVSFRAEDFEHALRMDAHGRVRGGLGDVDPHAELAAYACRLGDLIGELLGAGTLSALDTHLRPSGECLIFRDPASGDSVLLRPRAHVQLHQLKTQLSL